MTTPHIGIPVVKDNAKDATIELTGEKVYVSNTPVNMIVNPASDEI
ncbi:hypothetical protein EV11_0147 [Prochlorococcus sp. SS52]|nr:hypothetical protein EV04_1984 [Prochlorococcus marinus str. LG]KGG22595.1 hypothetical protein EV08_0010 [Prochlorococcus marinus str. SS2]KGG24252.1 hypothetical protein EV09_0859 [Prochlorococcus marinus str. SS35]KGG33135.1 hypothetical protein EV10_0768 [Prochlorococcus marinus str. SS51]KGG37443.1 hypothetical protein EV11_0147 [Prochlorococcus sp. SS52]